MRVILASQSPRRRELLSALGFTLTLRPAHIDEDPAPGERPEALVKRLAAEKAGGIEGQELVVAADTVVALDDEILGKPANPDEAQATLARLSGLSHTVWTGVFVRQGDAQELFAVATEVHMRPLSEEEIARYVASGEPMDKAGAYGIQGAGGMLVESVFGSYTNVVGLPLRETQAAIFRLAGVAPAGGPR